MQAVVRFSVRPGSPAASEAEREAMRLFIGRVPDLVRLEVHEDLSVVAVVAAEDTVQALALVGELYGKALEWISGMPSPLISGEATEARV